MWSEIGLERERMDITCKYCDWWEEEHCVNEDSEHCREQVSEDFSCEWWEEEE